MKIGTGIGAVAGVKAGVNALDGAVAVPVSIAVTGTQTVAWDGTSQLTATATWSFGPTTDVTSSVTWTIPRASGMTTPASIGAATGLVTGLLTGTATATATLDGVIGTALITVPVQWPTTEAQLLRALGDGTAPSGVGFNAGFIMDQASGNKAASWGGLTMTAGNTPTYQNAGPLGASDYAVGFGSGDGNNDVFTAGDNLDATATDDVIMLEVFKTTASITGGKHMCGKRGPAAAGYHISTQGGTTGAMSLIVYDATNSFTATTTHASNYNAWTIAIGGFDRAAGAGTGRGILGTQNGVGATATPSPGSIGDCSNTTSLALGRPSSTTSEHLSKFFAIGVGSGKAAGVTTDVATWIANFKTAVGM